MSIWRVDSLIYLSGYLSILIDLAAEVIFSEASVELDNHLRHLTGTSSCVITWHGQVTTIVTWFGGNEWFRVAVETVHKLLFQGGQPASFHWSISGELTSGLADRSVWLALDNENNERW